MSAQLDACWARIGVRGDGSCPELERHVHCRNCPQYSAAARLLLDTRARDDLYGPAGVQDLLVDTPQEVGKHSILVFTVGAERFGLATRDCVEVVENRPIHSLPHMRSNAVLGLANIRGALLICLSLMVILQVSPAAPGKGAGRAAGAKRLLVMACEGGSLALPVDEVHGIVRYRTSDLLAVPTNLTQSATRHTHGVLETGAGLVGVLDTERLSQSIARALT